MSSRTAFTTLLLAAAAQAHPSGFHKRTRVTVSAREVQVLLTLDVDSGKRCALLRGGADLDRDGQISDEQALGLERKLAGLAKRPLRLEISGYPVSLREEGAKLSLRGDRRVSEEGLSVAVLLRARLPGKVSEGMELSVEDSSPDRSHVVVEVHQASALDAGEEPPVQGELLAGQKLRARLGRLLTQDPE